MSDSQFVKEATNDILQHFDMYSKSYTGGGVGWGFQVLLWLLILYWFFPDLYKKQPVAIF